MNKAYITYVNTSFFGIKIPYNEHFNKDIRLIPGARFSNKLKTWLFPKELVSSIETLAKNHEFSIASIPNTSSNPGIQQESALFLFQKQAVDKILENHGGLLSFEMGLGKTPTSIIAINSLLGSAKNILVVCPANVRVQWMNQWKKWSPKESRKIFIISKGSDYRYIENTNTIIIVSYGLLNVDILKTIPFGAIIADESQEIKNSKAKRTKGMLELAELNKNAIKLALTGTPINEPKDFWSQLNFIYPERYGTYWTFVRRYCNVFDNGYGLTIQGINEDNKLEFENRVTQVSCRVTRSDLPPGTIPPLNIHVEHIVPDGNIFMDEKQFQSHKNVLDSHVLLCGYKKIASARDKVNKLLIEDKESPICILTYHIETAKLLADFFNTSCITGLTSITERQQIAESVINKEDGPRILVCSMKSIGVGVDYLTPFTRVVFAELYWSPIVMTQVIGRFSRLSSLSGTDIYFLVLQGTIDELISSTLKRKIDNLSTVMKTTEAEQALSNTFSISEDEEEQFILALTDIASSYVRTEYDD